MHLLTASDVLSSSSRLLPLILMPRIHALHIPHLQEHKYTRLHLSERGRDLCVSLSVCWSVWLSHCKTVMLSSVNCRNCFCKGVCISISNRSKSFNYVECHICFYSHRRRLCYATFSYLRSRVVLRRTVRRSVSLTLERRKTFRPLDQSHTRAAAEEALDHLREVHALCSSY